MIYLCHSGPVLGNRHLICCHCSEADLAFGLCHWFRSMVVVAYIHFPGSHAFCSGGLYLVPLCCTPHVSVSYQGVVHFVCHAYDTVVVLLCEIRARCVHLYWDFGQGFSYGHFLG